MFSEYCPMLNFRQSWSYFQLLSKSTFYLDLLIQRNLKIILKVDFVKSKVCWQGYHYIQPIIYLVPYKDQPGREKIRLKSSNPCILLAAEAAVQLKQL